MTDKEVLEKLNEYLKEVNEMLALGDLGLLKSEELWGTKHKIEDELKVLKQHFGKVESLKIEKTIPNMRGEARRGMFLDANQVNPALKDLHILLQELIKAKGGSEQIQSVSIPELQITGSTINQAINDAKVLLQSQGATSAVDRIHTVLHGYLKKICENSGISYPEDATLNQLLNLLKTSHRAFNTPNENVEHILKSMANIFDKLNPVRNDASLAHPNPTLLEAEEALLVINSTNTILAYLDAKIKKI